LIVIEDQELKNYKIKILI